MTRSADPAPLVVVAETGSTNADLLARITGGQVPIDGEWLVALRQTAGRGRLNRAWQGRDGNFAGSCALRLRPGDPPPQTLSFVTALALHRALRALSPAAPLILKWPNDVLLDEGKLAGILLERTGDWVVVGIGVNLAEAPPVADRRTAALAQFGPAPPVEAFASDLRDALADEVSAWRAEGAGQTLARWTQAAHPPGTPLSVQLEPATRLHGRFGGVTGEGALRLSLPGGGERVIHAGDVALL